MTLSAYCEVKAVVVSAEPNFVSERWSGTTNAHIVKIGADNGLETHYNKSGWIQFVRPFSAQCRWMHQQLE